MTSNLKIAFLTADTPHHKALLKAVMAKYPNIHVFEEKREISASFETRHESDITTFAPDALISFGTGRVGEALLNIRPDRFVTLHAGDPEQYRGLDTRFWAIYHGDFKALMA